MSTSHAEAQPAAHAPAKPWRPTLAQPSTYVYFALFLAFAALILAQRAHAGIDPVIGVLAAAYAVLASLLSAIDLKVMRLPNVLVLPGQALALLGVAGWSLATGDWSHLLLGAAGGAVTFALYWIIGFIGMAGYGDVKFSFIGGTLVGAAGGWWSLAQMLILIGLSGILVLIGVLVGRAVAKFRHFQETEGRGVDFGHMFTARAAYGPAIALGSFLALAGAPDIWISFGLV